MHNKRDPTKCSCQTKAVDIVSVILTIAIAVMSIGLLGTLFEPSSSSGGSSNKTPSIKVDGSVNFDGSFSVDVNGVEEQPENNTTLYLKPNSNWLQSNARFAVYVWGNGVNSLWYDMTETETEGYYQVTLPADYAEKNIIFCRMDPGNPTNNWGSGEGKPFWNQTSDLVIPSDNTNCYVITESTEVWNNGTGEWVTYPDCLTPEENTEDTPVKIVPTEVCIGLSTLSALEKNIKSLVLKEQKHL